MLALSPTMCLISDSSKPPKFHDYIPDASNRVVCRKYHDNCAKYITYSISIKKVTEFAQHERLSNAETRPKIRAQIYVCSCHEIFYIRQPSMNVYARITTTEQRRRSKINSEVQEIVKVNVENRNSDRICTCDLHVPLPI